MHLAADLGMFVLITIILGLVSHVLGEALPRRWFHPDRAPFAAWAWERGGRFYRKTLKIDKWKDKLPDKSRAVASMVPKRVAGRHSSAALYRLAQETCVAETVHWALLLCSWIYLLFLPRPLAWIAAVGYALSHLPFIAIQRYNRPRLLRAVKHAVEEESGNEIAGLVEQ